MIVVVVAGSRGGLYAAQSQEGLISKGKSKQLGSLVRSPSKESINSMGSLGSESSFFSGGHNKFAEVMQSNLVRICRITSQSLIISKLLMIS